MAGPDDGDDVESGTMEVAKSYLTAGNRREVFSRRQRLASIQAIIIPSARLGTLIKTPYQSAIDA